MGRFFLFNPIIVLIKHVLDPHQSLEYTFEIKYQRSSEISSQDFVCSFNSKFFDLISEKIEVKKNFMIK